MENRIRNINDVIMLLEIYLRVSIAEMSEDTLKEVVQEKLDYLARYYQNAQKLSQDLASFMLAPDQQKKEKALSKIIVAYAPPNSDLRYNLVPGGENRYSVSFAQEKAEIAVALIALIGNSHWFEFSCGSLTLLAANIEIRGSFELLTALRTLQSKITCEEQQAARRQTEVESQGYTPSSGDGRSFAVLTQMHVHPGSYPGSVVRAERREVPREVSETTPFTRGTPESCCKRWMCCVL